MADDNRRTLKLDPDLFEDLDGDRGDRTWNEYLNDLHQDAPIERIYSDVSDAQVTVIADRTAEKVVQKLGEQ